MTVPLPSALSTRTPMPAGARNRAIVPGDRGESPARILGVDAALDGVAAGRHVLRREGERRTARDEDLLADEVDPGGHLGHRMLDLDAGVHLQEGELARRDRAGTRPCPRRGSRPRAPAPPRLRPWRGGSRPECPGRAPLRAASGGGAAPSSRGRRRRRRSPWLSAMSCTSMWRGSSEVALQIDLGVGEGSRRLARRAEERRLHFLRSARDAKSAAAAAARGLHRDRIAVLGAPGERIVDRRRPDRPTRHDRHAGGGGDAPRLDLVAHRRDRRRRAARRRRCRLRRRRVAKAAFSARKP